MNHSQEGKYWRVWSATLKALRGLGHDRPADVLRHWIHVRAIGRDKAHLAFNNHDFDGFLRICAGYTHMEDVALQLRLLAMPVERAMLIAAPYLDEIGVEQPGREAYVRAIYKRVQARRPERGEPVFELDQIPDDDLPLIISALLHTAQHKHRIGHNHPITGRGRARYDHRVGERRRKHPPGEQRAAVDQAPAAPARPTVSEPAPAKDGDPF